jgi:hypothetical protein
MSPSIKWVLAVLFAIVFATPALATEWGDVVNDPSRPGSVLVFPKFVRGTVTTADQGTLGRSQFDISVDCPADAVCAERAAVKLLAHWVCPGSQRFEDKWICRETNFELFTTVKGTVTISPDNVGPITTRVPTPPCQQGYLIVWVVTAADGDLVPAISFNGLVGQGTLRRQDGGYSTYAGIPIQSPLPTLTGTTPTRTDYNGNRALDFNGVEYALLPDRVLGTTRYENATDPANVQAFLTLITLDVFSNRSNTPVFVDLVYYTPGELPLSTFHEFICFTQKRLAGPNGIDENLVNTFMGNVGFFESGPASDIFFRPRSILGLIEYIERDAGGTILRESVHPTYNDGNYTSTRFYPRGVSVID